jgi:hypothetical protein
MGLEVGSSGREEKSIRSGAESAVPKVVPGLEFAPKCFFFIQVFNCAVKLF